MKPDVPAEVSRQDGGLAPRLARAAVQNVGTRAGDPAEPAIKGDRLEIRTARPRYRLAELLDQIAPDDRPESFDVAPVGAELL